MPDLRGKNVILLVIDSLTHNRLGCAGVEPSPCPTLDRLMDSGIRFTEHFANGCPTMFALPGIFTSTPSLESGGYDIGIRDRAASMPEVFRDAGYRTAAFTASVAAARLYHYDRGFQHFAELFDFGLLVKYLTHPHVRHLAFKVREGRKSLADSAGMLEAFLREWFPAAIVFCATKEAELRDGSAIRSPVVYGWDFAAARELLEEAEREFRTASRSYAERMIQEDPDDTLFARLERLRREGTAQNADVEAIIAEYGAIGRPNGHSASGRYVIDHLCRWIDAQADGPFFAFAHLLDVHDLDFVSLEDPLNRTVLRAEAHAERRLREGIAEAGDAFQGDPAYQCSIRYCDTQLRRLVEFLEDRGLMDDTVLVVTSDHGSFRTGWPDRPADYHVMRFYDELYHVPLVVYHPALEPGCIRGLTSHLDLAPTLLELVGLRVPASFQGYDVLAPGCRERDHVLMEHLHAGPCDFDDKPILICVRTSSHKALCELPPAASGAEPFISKAFDLADDPLEQNDLTAHPDRLAPFLPLLEIARARGTEIRAQLP
jgi:arylsulfatase A-like enzyme